MLATDFAGILDLPDSCGGRGGSARSYASGLDFSSSAIFAHEGRRVNWCFFLAFSDYDSWREMDHEPGTKGRIGSGKKLDCDQAAVMPNGFVRRA
jgi:hypothetical protein